MALTTGWMYPGWAKDGKLEAQQQAQRAGFCEDCRARGLEVEWQLLAQRAVVRRRGLTVANLRESQVMALSTEAEVKATIDSLVALADRMETPEWAAQQVDAAKRRDAEARRRSRELAEEEARSGRLLLGGGNSFTLPSWGGRDPYSMPDPDWYSESQTLEVPLRPTPRRREPEKKAREFEFVERSAGRAPAALGTEEAL